MTRLAAAIYIAIAAALLCGAVATWVSDRGVIEARERFTELRHHDQEGR